MIASLTKLLTRLSIATIFYALEKHNSLGCTRKHLLLKFFFVILKMNGTIVCYIEKIEVET